MDVADETRKFKVLLYAGIFMVMSAIFAWGELMWKLRGEIADATVKSVEQREVQSRRSGPRTVYRARYAFTDSKGAARTATYDYDADDAPGVGSTVSVRYMPGPTGEARPADKVNWIGLGIFFVSFGFLGFQVGRLVKDSIDYSKENKARRAQMAKKPYRY